MPGKRRRNTRRLTRPRRRNQVARFVPRGTGHVAPNQMKVRLAYSVNYVASAAGSLSPNTGYFQFTGNSIYNPDLQTLIERFPIGVAQWSHLYQRYFVQRSSLRVTAQPIAGITAAEANWLIVAHPYTNTIPAGAVVTTDFLGQPYSSKLYSAGPISNVVTQTASFSSATVFSRPLGQIHNSETTSGFLNSATYQPVDQWFWTVVFSNSTAAATFPAINFSFTLEFDVILFQNGWANLAVHDTTGAYVEKTPETDFCPCPPPAPIEEMEEKDPVDVQARVVQNNRPVVQLEC